MGSSSTDIGDRLYEVVDEYATLGDHRTGSSTDAATRGWFAARLESRRASVDTTSYDFERYDATASVTIDGRDVPSLPVFYSGTGTVGSSTPFVGEVDVARVLEEPLDECLVAAHAVGAPVAVLATKDPNGRLVARNRSLDRSPGPPAVLVAGRELDALRDGSVRVDVEARIVPGRSETVVARFGSEHGPPLVITTPLTGWFSCAGERGTGIAIAIEIAASLAARVPVLVVGTTGHELEHLGARAYLEQADLAPRAVVHLGASLAAGDRGDDGVLTLGALRFAFLDGVGPTEAVVRAALAPAEVTLMTGLRQWPGEGEEWRKLGAPVLSFVGGFDRFHTADDITEAVTEPALLTRVHDAVLGAALAVSEGL